MILMSLRSTEPVSWSATERTASTTIGAIVLEYSETTLELREVLALFSSMSRSDSSTGTDICVCAWKSGRGG
jgi:hypothetical protein